PLTEKKLKTMPKHIINNIPNQNGGIAIPSCVTEEKNRSLTLCCRCAMKIPNGIATTTTIIIDIRARDSVTGKRLKIKSLTGLEYLIDTPKSAVMIPFIQSVY